MHEPKEEQSFEAEDDEAEEVEGSSGYFNSDFFWKASYVAFGIALFVPLVTILVYPEKSLESIIFSVFAFGAWIALKAAAEGEIFKIAIPTAIILLIGVIAWGPISDYQKESYRKESAARSAREAKIKARGPVYNSEWDGSVSQAEKWLDSNVHDSDYKVESWGDVQKVDHPRFKYVVWCKVRAKNAFGAQRLVGFRFHLDGSGRIVNVEQF